MKKQILTLAFVMLTIGSIYTAAAQTDLKKAFDENSTTFDKEPISWVQNLPENIRFFGGNGEIFNKQQTLELAKRTASGKSTSSFADLRVKQSGKLGVVSGIRTHDLAFTNGLKMSWKDAFTYTFEWQNNQWVHTDIHHTKIDYQTGEEAAVRQVIDAETKAYHEANLAVWRTNWATTPYIERQDEKLRKMANTPYLKGEALQKAYEEFAKTHKPTGLTPVVSDYESHVAGNMAWATYTQEDKKADGSVGQKQRSLRILEKINGQWKIVMISLTGF